MQIPQEQKLYRRCHRWQGSENPGEKIPGISEEQQKGECGLEQSDQGRYEIKHATEGAVHVMEDFIGHYKDYGFY